MLVILFFVDRTKINLDSTHSMKITEAKTLVPGAKQGLLETAKVGHKSKSLNEKQLGSFK